MICPPPFTTTIAIDMQHMGEFRLASQTWRKNRVEMWKNPLIVFADVGTSGESQGWWLRWLRRACDHPQISVVGVHDVPGSTQRHRMLSSLVYGPAAHVATDWFIKIDCDTLALKPPASGWVHPNWFQEKEPYEYVTASWNYTRGKEMWANLLQWAETVPQFAGAPEAPGFLDPIKDHVRHPRIISYVMFTRTRFVREVVALHPGPLMPIPSQDTFLWYCGVRLQKRYAGVRMKKFGWHHGARGMEKRVRAILEEV